MKVLHVETGRHLYGGALQVRFLLDGLAAGWPADEHVLVCPRDAAIAAALRDRVRVVELPLGGDLDLGAAFRLRRLFAEERPDLVHLHSRRGADLWARSPPARSTSRSSCHAGSTTPSRVPGWP